MASITPELKRVQNRWILATLIAPRDCYVSRRVYKNASLVDMHCCLSLEWTGKNLTSHNHNNKSSLHSKKRAPVFNVNIAWQTETCSPFHGTKKLLWKQKWKSCAIKNALENIIIITEGWKQKCIWRAFTLKIRKDTHWVKFESGA